MLFFCCCLFTYLEVFWILESICTPLIRGVLDVSITPTFNGVQQFFWFFNILSRKPWAVLSFNFRIVPSNPRHLTNLTAVRPEVAVKTCVFWRNVSCRHSQDSCSISFAVVKTDMEKNKSQDIKVKGSRLLSLRSCRRFKNWRVNCNP